MIASDKPLEINMKNDLLHNDSGAAVLYGDGFGVWALNGVRVSKEIVETPKNDMPIEWWANEKNVEIRHEIEKKMGSERVLRELDGKALDSEIITIGAKDLPYELIEFSFENGDMRRALRMSNPSTGENHTEWVPPIITTCREALTWRNGTEELPQVIT